VSSIFRSDAQRAGEKLTLGACDVCLSHLDVDLGIRGRAIGLLARVLYATFHPRRTAAQD
jgi:hypothetical protein